MIAEKVSPRYARILKFLEMEHGEITVGIHGAEGGAPHEGGESIAAIGEAHEFGAGVPQRSFLRAWFDERQSEIEKTIQAQLELSLQRGKSLDWALERVAVWAQADIQKRIAAGIDPPNAPSTIQRKGSSKPLIDTGVLKAAILAYYNGKRAPQ